MNIESLTARITEIETEIASISQAFNLKKAEVAQLNEQWQAYASKAQLKLTHLEGCKAEANRIKGELEAMAPPPETTPV